MRKVQDNSRSDSGSKNGSKTSGSGNGSQKFVHIKSANRKVRLLDILRHYGLRIEKNHQRPTWSNNMRCPLPTHKGGRERTASFGYCFVSDHYNCMGCGQSGRAVEFISLMEGTSRSSVAERILSQYGEDINSDDYEYEDDLTPILIEGSSFVQALTQKYKDNPAALKKIDKIVWWLDFYLMAKAPGQNVTAEDLKHRIAKAKELLTDEMLNSG